MKTKCEHIELSTDDPGRARDFYGKLFGWKIDAMPNPDGNGEYLMFRTDNGGGGITAKMMPQQPTAWMPYITVDSVQRTLDAAGTLGGSTIVGHTSIGEMGAIGVLADPTGATVGIWETSKPAPAKADAKPAKVDAKPAKPEKAAKPAAKAAKPAAKAAKPAAKAAKKPAKKGKR